jgi:hypothetical protein
VPVIPSGSILPQLARPADRDPGTGAPSERLHSVPPLAASIAATVLLSLATISTPGARPGRRQ